jgi:hypothetical protein
MADNDIINERLKIKCTLRFIMFLIDDYSKYFSATKII